MRVEQNKEEIKIKEQQITRDVVAMKDGHLNIDCISIKEQIKSERNHKEKDHIDILSLFNNQEKCPFDSKVIY